MTFQKKGALNAFFSMLSLVVLGSRLARADYFTFLNNGPSSNRVDIVFLGDGYTSTQLGTYQSHVASMMNHMFNEGEDPFPRYNRFFNAHRIDVISQDSGADDPNTGTYVNTALDATYRYDGVTQRLLYISEGKANSALATGLNGAFAADMKLVTVNATQYGGGGGTYAVYAGGNTSAREVALHELGHSFAGLADEYGGIPGPYSGSEPGEVNITKDSTGAKWSQWIGYNQPGIGVIGAYNGGGYYDSGIYRPSLNSKMRALNNPFDAISREEFILDIYRIVDPLDAWLDNSAPLTNPFDIWVESVDPSIIQHEWFVDGMLVPGATSSGFNPLAFGFGPGNYTVTARSFDPTPWVRRDFDLLSQSVTWNVLYSIPEPAAIYLVGLGLFVLSSRRLRKESHGSQIH